MNFINTSRVVIANLLLIIASFSLNAQENKINAGKISGDFGSDCMYYMTDTTIGALKQDQKFRTNTFLNLRYNNGGFTAGLRYEFYLYPLIDMQENGYAGQGLTNYFAEYQNNFIQVTAGTCYEQFGNGLTLRAYEERRLGVDNSILGGKVRIYPYKGITIKGVWGLERKNFDFDYLKRKDNISGADAEINFSEVFPVMNEKGFDFGTGASFVSKFEKSVSNIGPYHIYEGSDSTVSVYIPSSKIPQNVGIIGVRTFLGYKDFRIEGEYALKSKDPNARNDYIYNKGQALFLSATYSMKGLGISTSFLSTDNIEFRSNRLETENSLMQINYVPAINRQYTYQLLGSYAYSSQANSQIGGQIQINYLIPKKTKIGGKYGTDITFNYSRFHSQKQDSVDLAIENGDVRGTDGHHSGLFKASKNLLYQDVGIEISRRLTKDWKLILAYNFITYDLWTLQGHGRELFYGHNVAAEVTYKINPIHALRLELQHLYSKQDAGSWLYGMLEYSINPHWFISVGNQWNYGNENKDKRSSYYNLTTAFIYQTTRIALSIGKTREGILCVGGVCRPVLASFGLGLSVSTSF